MGLLWSKPRSTATGADMNNSNHQENSTTARTNAKILKPEFEDLEETVWIFLTAIGELSDLDQFHRRQLNEEEQEL